MIKDRTLVINFRYAKYYVKGPDIIEAVEKHFLNYNFSTECIDDFLSNILINYVDLLEFVRLVLNWHDLKDRAILTDLEEGEERNECNDFAQAIFYFQHL